MNDTVEMRFHRAAGTVSGSGCKLRTKDTKVLIDCGMFQGTRTLEVLNHEPLPFNPIRDRCRYSDPCACRPQRAPPLSGSKRLFRADLDDRTDRRHYRAIAARCGKAPGGRLRAPQPLTGRG